MRKIFFIPMLFLITLLVLSFSPDLKRSSRILHPGQVQSGYSEFLIGCYDNGFDINYNNTEDFSFNLWHQYTDFYYNTTTSGFGVRGWDWYQNPSYDQLNNPISEYGARIESRLTSNQSNDMRTLMMRPKLRWLTYGQRSDYQCEPVDVSDGLWFYAFNIHETGTPETDNGAGVMHCEAGTDSPGFVVKSLRANNEQVNVAGLRMEGDNLHNWIIKPRIRIDSSFASNPSNSLTPICRIVIYNYYGEGHDSNKIMDETISVRNLFNGAGTYNGKYLEEFNGLFPLDMSLDALPTPTDKNLFNPWKEPWEFSSRGTNTNSPHCKMDIQVEWLGNCDMWIDYVRVDNEVAHELFRGDRADWISWEGDLSEYNSSPLKVYVDEFEFNNIPCMKYVSDSIYKYSGNKIKVMCDLNIGTYNVHLPEISLGADHVKDYLIEPLGSEEVMLGPYPFDGNSYINTTISKIPSSLPKDTGWQVLGTAVSPSVYETWLQDDLDDGKIWSLNSYMQLADELSKESDLPYVAIVQSHLWYGGDANGAHRLREPTVEEQDMLVNISLCYGAKALMYFWYKGFYANIKNWGFGLYQDDNLTVPRYLNAYEQPKWQRMQELNAKVKKWGEYLISFDNANRKSYRYQISSERSSMASDTFIDSMKTYPPVEFAPDPIDPDLDQLPPDPANTTFVQAAFFNDPGDTEHNKYFMIVNRRCSPYIDNSSVDSIGGRRLIAFYPNQSKLPGFNNWKVINLEDSSTVWTFDKNSNSPVYIGDFMPGEGKLYKLAPVMQEGGTLVVNENITGQTFDCKGEVLNNGKNITLKSSIISFTETGTITMTGGVFSSGTLNTPADSVVFKAKNSHWDGIGLFGCDTVRMFYSNFSGLKNEAGNSLLLLSECYKTDIRNSRFDITTNQAVNAIKASFNFITEPPNPSVLFKSNLFLTNGNKASTVRVLSNASAVLPVIFETNYFYGNKPEPEAIFLENTVGGVIKQNVISGYARAINMVSSSMDLYGNVIETNMSGAYSNSCNIMGTAGSVISMQPSGLYYTGGNNNLSFTGSTIPNVLVQNSIFKMASGTNIFNISTSDTSHLYGYFPYSVRSHPTNASGNCFNVASSNTSAISNVTNGSGGSPITFTFTAYNCGGIGSSVKGDGSLSQQDYIIVPVTDTYNDTIFMRTEGTMDIWGQLDLETRKRNYDSAIVLAQTILDDPDTLQSPGAIQKLYLASLMKNDSSNTAISQLKTYLEGLILNNSGNEALIERAFYFIQKCKVVLKDYGSAMDGFADIVNQNPYTYEALVASWDYSATSLLQGGQGGGQREYSENEAQNLFTLKTFFDGDPKSDRKDNYDKTKFSVNDRQVIKENIKNAFEDKRNKKLVEIKVIEEESTHDPMKKNELKTMNALNSTAKVKDANDIHEHIERVNSDIDIVFGQTDGESLVRDEQNTIPDDYELSQNYPNPFNPTTKIRYALPKEGKVQIVIFDIVGREVAKLVNNEFNEAGRYVNEFDGSRLSSGIYFYRILVNDGKDFTQVKKMVLVK